MKIFEPYVIDKLDEALRASRAMTSHLLDLKQAAKRRDKAATVKAMTEARDSVGTLRDTMRAVLELLR